MAHLVNGTIQWIGTGVNWSLAKVSDIGGHLCKIGADIRGGASSLRHGTSSKAQSVYNALPSYNTIRHPIAASEDQLRSVGNSVLYRPASKKFNALLTLVDKWIEKPLEITRDEFQTICKNLKKLVPALDANKAQFSNADRALINALIDTLERYTVDNTLNINQIKIIHLRPLMGRPQFQPDYDADEDGEVFHSLSNSYSSSSSDSSEEEDIPDNSESSDEEFILDNSESLSGVRKIVEKFCSLNKGVVTKLKEEAEVTFEAIGDSAAKKITAIVDHTTHNAEGLLNNAAQKMEDAVNRVETAVNTTLERMEQLPHNVINGGLGVDLVGKPLPFAPSSGTTTTTSTSGTTTPTATTQTKTLSEFANQCSQYLEGLCKNGVQSVSKQALTAFCSMTVLGLKSATDTMGDSPNFSALKAQVEKVITKLEEMPNTGNWIKCLKALQQVKEAAAPVNLSINGFAVPQFGSTQKVDLSSVRKSFSESIDTLTPPSSTLPSTGAPNWKELARKEKDLFILNASSYITLKIIYEKFCGRQPDHNEFYTQIIQNSRKEDEYGVLKIDDELLETNFFQMLVDKKVGFFKRGIAKLSYMIYQSVIKKSVKNGASAYFEEAFGYIETQQPNGFDSLRNKLATNFTRYLTILNGSYRSIAMQPHPTGTLDEMLTKELERPESNMGLTSQQLYLKFANNVLKKATGSSFTARIFHFLIGNEDQIIDGLLRSGATGMRDENGYTHAFNVVIREQLELVWELLKKNDASNVEYKISSVRKQEIATLIQNLYDVLQQANCKSIEELRQLTEGKNFGAKVNQTVDGIFMGEVLEQVTIILTAVTESLIKEDQLQKMTYKLTNLLNYNFELDRKFTQAEMQREEERIQELSSQILNFAVGKAVNEKFDFTGERKQQITNQYVVNAHQQSFTFAKEASALIEELKALDPNAPEANQKIETLKKKALDHQKHFASALSELEGSSMSSADKKIIQDRFAGIAEQSKTLITTIGMLNNQSAVLQNKNHAVEQLNEVLSCLRSISAALFDYTPPRYDAYDEKLILISNRLGTLGAIPGLGNHPTLISNAAIDALEKTNLYRKLLHRKDVCSKLRQPNALLHEITERKKQELRDSMLPKESINLSNMLLQTDLQNHMEQADLAQLAQAIEAIKKATTDREIDQAKMQLTAILGQIEAATNAQMTVVKTQCQGLIATANTAINNTQLFDRDARANTLQTSRETVQEAENRLTAFVDWAKTGLGTFDLQKPWEEQQTRNIPYLNVPLMDLQWMNDTATNLVASRVQSQTEGTLLFLKKEHTFLYGIMRHSILSPYVRENGG